MLIVKNVDSKSALEHLAKLKPEDFKPRSGIEIVIRSLIQEPMFWYSLLLMLSSIIGMILI
jgi:hypothetical protein